MWSVPCPEPEDTQRAAALLVSCLDSPMAVALLGGLGAGKTCFAQGCGSALGVAGPVTSPTFVLVAEYDGDWPLLHADLYRLEPGQLASTGLEESLEQWEGLALVEWADRFPEVMPAEHLVVRLTERVLEIDAVGPGAAALSARWREACGV